MENRQVKHTHSSLNSLSELVQKLRGENGCPWDRKQTPRTVIVYLIEEVYELAEAIEGEDPQHIREELGDVLFHVFLIARMFEEQDSFDIQQTAGAVIEKMVRRHPHVFGNRKIKNSEEVIKNWHKIKQEEKKAKPGNSSMLDSVPVQLPALVRAYRISEHAARTGVERSSFSGLLQAIRDRLDELEAAIKKASTAPGPRQYGDMLFDLVRLAPFIDVHPEIALTGSIRKFIRRFKKMEGLIADSGRDLEALSDDETSLFWQQAAQP